MTTASHKPTVLKLQPHLKRDLFLPGPIHQMNGKPPSIFRTKLRGQSRRSASMIGRSLSHGWGGRSAVTDSLIRTTVKGPGGSPSRKGVSGKGGWKASSN